MRVNKVHENATCCVCSCPVARKLFSYIQHTKCYMRTVHRTSGDNAARRQGHSPGILKEPSLWLLFLLETFVWLAQPHCVKYNNGIYANPPPPRPRFQDYNSYERSLLASLAMLIEMETLYIMNALPFTLQGFVLYVLSHPHKIRAKIQGHCRGYTLQPKHALALSGISNVCTKHFSNINKKHVAFLQVIQAGLTDRII
jgi:hypothetical protein